MDTARNWLEQLITKTKALEPEISTQDLHLINESDVQATTPSSQDTSSEWTSSEVQRPLKRKRKEQSSTSVEAVTATADAFLERLSSTSIPNDEVLSYTALTNIRNQPIAPRGENVSRAWEMCINFARRSSQKLKYGRFLRFLSLCFFLIWEKYSDKQGKSAAREVSPQTLGHSSHWYRTTDSGSCSSFSFATSLAEMA